ncbi:MAG: ankyrin repeat domain-containing protein [Planctomycetes bacterium]|nr:ankyrin repeat domain-containing protein [Planctomycetota bacterium]
MDTDTSTLVTEMIFGFVFGLLLSWSVGLAPALIYRYVIYKRPIEKKKAFWRLAPVVTILMFVFKLTMAGLSGTNPNPNPIPWVIIYYIGKWIMTRQSKARAVSAPVAAVAAAPNHRAAAPPPLPNKPSPPAAAAAKPKKRTHGCLVAFLVCLGIFIVLAALDILFGGGQAVMKSAGKSMIESPLCVAAAAGNWQEIDRLLARGVNPNQSAMMGHSALIMATDNGHVQIAERLLKAGADPNQKDNLGWAPLHHAVKTDAANLDMITMLARYRANVNITDKHLRTPLHRAAQFGHVEAVRLLLRWGADPAARDENGWTPQDRGAAHPSVVALLNPRPVARVWTGRNGTQITATFQKEAGGYVYLQKQDGSQIQTQRSNLSDADVAYLNSMR